MTFNGSSAFANPFNLIVSVLTRNQIREKNLASRDFLKYNNHCCFLLKCSHIFLGSVNDLHTGKFSADLPPDRPTIWPRQKLEDISQHRALTYDAVRLVLIAPLNCWRNSTPFWCKASARSKLTILEYIISPELIRP